MHKSFLIKIALILPFIGLSQNLIINTTNRNTTTLNGTWHYIVDPYQTGYYNYRHQPYDQLPENNNAAFYNNYHAKNKMELVEYNFDTSPTLLVSGDWNSQKEKLFYYEGTIWYKKSFDYNLPNKKRLFLYFGAINYKAEVYLNGKKLGTHIGGFAPFNFEVTSIVKPAGNYLVVKVDNTRHKDAVPTTNTDWWNYGGITRDVKLIEEPLTFIQDYNIQLKKNDKNSINGYVKLNKGSKSEKVIISIPELKIEKQLTIDNDGKVKFEIKSKKIKYWNPKNPKLYDVSIKTDYQTLKDQIGFRTIETKESNILLNGKSIFLRGISIHEENPMRGSRAYSTDDALVALNWAKELGCNYVRLAHYPHNEHMLKINYQKPLLEIKIELPLLFGLWQMKRLLQKQEIILLKI